MTKNQVTVTLFVVGIASSIAVSIFLPSAATLVINATLYFLFGD